MDRLDAMATLLAAIDGGSLSAASRARGMPLATVSRKVSELEAHLRTRLIVRTSRKLVLTEAGAAYVDAIRRILEDVGEAERAASGEYLMPQGSLAITAPVVFGRLHVQPVILEFLHAFPAVSVRLTLADSSLVATRLGAIGWVTCGSPAYLAVHGTPRYPSELADHACVVFTGRYASTIWSFANNVEVQIEARLSVNTAEAAIDAAIAGLGITRVLSYQANAALRAGTLAQVLADFAPAPQPVSLLHAGQSRMPLKLRAFLDFATPRLRTVLARLSEPQ